MKQRLASMLLTVCSPQSLHLLSRHDSCQLMSCEAEMRYALAWQGTTHWVGGEVACFFPSAHHRATTCSNFLSCSKLMRTRLMSSEPVVLPAPGDTLNLIPQVQLQIHPEGKRGWDLCRLLKKCGVRWKQVKEDHLGECMGARSSQSPASGSWQLTVLSWFPLGEIFLNEFPLRSRSILGAACVQRWMMRGYKILAPLLQGRTECERPSEYLATCRSSWSLHLRDDFPSLLNLASFTPQIFVLRWKISEPCSLFLSVSWVTTVGTGSGYRKQALEWDLGLNHSLAGWLWRPHQSKVLIVSSKKKIAVIVKIYN
jgi:hypothetical protein